MKLRTAVSKIGKGLLLALAVVLSLVAVAGTGSYLVYLNWEAERLAQLVAGSQIAETAAGPMEYKLLDGEGRVTLFIHGRPGGYDSAPAESLTGRLLAPSRPGYLNTPLTTGRTPQEQAAAYLALLDALNIEEPVVVVGASAGGPSAIAFAAHYPERTAALILGEPLSQAETGGGWPPFMRSDFTVWAMFSAIKVLQGREGLVAMAVSEPENRPRILEDPRKAAAFEELVWSIWPMSRRFSGIDNDSAQFASLDLPYAKVKVPTLIIHGTRDSNVPFADSQKLAKAIPGALLHAIEGADHMMPFTHQDEVLAVQRNFLGRHGLL